MLSVVLLATSCLDIFGSAHSAYSVRLGDKVWQCGVDENAPAEAFWYRVDGREGALRDPADVDDIEAMFRPLREYDDQLHGLREKMGAYAGERVRLRSEQGRLTGKLERYASGSDKNRAISEELRVADERLATIDAAWTEMARDEERLDAERRRELESIRVRLGVLVERALRR